MSATTYIRCLIAQLKDNHQVTSVRVIKESWWQMTAIIGNVALHANDAILKIEHDGRFDIWPCPSLKGKETDTLKAMILQTL